MNVEKTILGLIPVLLRKYDKKKSGVTLDIGVGTFNFLHKYLNWSAPVSPTKAQLVTPH